MSMLAEIEARTKAYAEARTKLSEVVQALQDGIKALQREQLPGIKRAIARAVERHEELQALIEDEAQLFTRPRTRTFHGIKVGYRKGKGNLSAPKPEKAMELIRKHLGDKADVLIQTKEVLVNDAVKNLSPEELKLIGCSYQAGKDCVVIQPIDGEVEKMIDALLDGALQEEDG